MFNRKDFKVRPLSEELEGIGLDPSKVMDDIERNSGLLEQHAGSPPTSEAVRPRLTEENESSDNDEHDTSEADDNEQQHVEWDGSDLEEDEDLVFLGERMVRRKRGFRVDPKTGKLVKVTVKQKRKEKAARRKKKGQLRAAAKMYYKRKKAKIKKRRKRLSKVAKKGFIVRQEGVAAQLQQLREELENSDTNTGEVSPHEEAAINGGWLAWLLGECFEAMGDIDAGNMLYAMSESAVTLSEAIEAAGGEVSEELQSRLASLLEGVTKALATHEEIGSPSLFESIQMGVENGLYEDDEEDDDEDLISEDDDEDIEPDEDNDDKDNEIDFEDDE